jgi:hypothetical protein
LTKNTLLYYNNLKLIPEDINMSLDATSLKSPSFMDSIDRTFPDFKELRENPKIRKVATQVFKGLACVACGAGLGLLACTPLGVSLGVGIGVGAAAGAFVYIAIASVHAAIQAFGFPSNHYLVAPPVSSDNLASEDKHKKFIKVLKKMTDLDCFQKWLDQKGLSPPEGADRLWKDFQGGLCQGQSQALVSLMKKHHELNGADLLGKLKPKKVFKRQILELIRADIPKNTEVEALVKNIPNANPIFQKSFSKAALKDNASLLLDALKDEKDALKDPFQALTATIRLQDDKGAHTIFVELHPTYRIYDSYNHIYTGLYEGFESEECFLKALQLHIQGYQSAIRPTALKYDDIIIRGYGVDCQKEKDKTLSATAGAQPI